MLDSFWPGRRHIVGEVPDSGEVVRRQHAMDTFQRLCRGRIDTGDSRMGERAAEHGHVDRSGRLDVGDEATPAPDEWTILPAGRGDPYPAGFLRGGHALPPSVDIAAAAACTDSTIFWYPVQRQMLPPISSRIS